MGDLLARLGKIASSFSSGERFLAGAALPGIEEAAAAEEHLHKCRRGGCRAEAPWASLGASSRKGGR